MTMTCGKSHMKDGTCRIESPSVCELDGHTVLLCMPARSTYYLIIHTRTT
jgi:hypothetical protein